MMLKHLHLQHIVFCFCENEIISCDNHWNKLILKCEAMSSQSHFAKKFQVVLSSLILVTSLVAAVSQALSVVTMKTYFFWRKVIGSLERAIPFQVQALPVSAARIHAEILRQILAMAGSVRTSLEI